MGRQKARSQQSQKRLDLIRESFVGQGLEQTALKPLFTALCKAQDCQPSFCDLHAVTLAAAKVRAVQKQVDSGKSIVLSYPLRPVAGRQVSRATGALYPPSSSLLLTDGFPA